MGFDRRNEAKRFILVDALYETVVKLLASAEAEPQDLYGAETGREAFEFHRTASRLIEMRSENTCQRTAEDQGAGDDGARGDMRPAAVGLRPNAAEISRMPASSPSRPITSSASARRP